MNAMSLAGRRGEVLWKGGSFVSGAGRQLHYDSFTTGFGIVVPLQLGELVHVWDLPATRFGSCKAIRLRPDAAFNRRVLMTNWSCLGGIALLVACPFLWAKVHTALGLLTLFPGIALIVLAIASCRADPRNRLIRLVLGPHAWGSSDPATWHTTIRKDVVDPQNQFEVKSFAALARQAIKEGDWGTAMWAARLYVAVENEEIGENLTDKILNHEEVRDLIQDISWNPGDRNRAFGKPPKLDQWISCNPEKHVFTIG